MDPTEFQKTGAGELVQISDAWAFVPSPLSPALELTPELLITLERARGALGELVGQARLVPNVDLILGPLSQREAVLSNRIEGTYTEVRSVLLYDAAPTAAAGLDQDLQEVRNYLRALSQAQHWLSDGRPLNAALVRALHAELVRGARGEDKHPGQYRLGQVYVGNQSDGLRMARYVPPPPDRVPPLMDDLTGFVDSDTRYGSLVDAAILHYQFEAIHPFEDGNGRLGRLLIPLFLLSKRVIDRPLLYLSGFFEGHRDEYLNLLKGVSTQGRWREWVLFFLHGVEAEAKDSRMRAERVLDLQARYRSDAGKVSKTALSAVDLILSRVFVSVPEVASHAQATYPTARSAVDALVELSILAPYEKRGGKQLWVAKELLDTVYEV